MIATEFCWASETRHYGWPTPEECEAEGWTRVAQHPLWPHSWRMRRDGRD